jgi:hypothetical protein
VEKGVRKTLTAVDEKTLVGSQQVEPPPALLADKNTIGTPIGCGACTFLALRAYRLHSIKRTQVRTFSRLQ